MTVRLSKLMLMSYNLNPRSAPHLITSRSTKNSHEIPAECTL